MCFCVNKCSCLYLPGSPGSFKQCDIRWNVCVYECVCVCVCVHVHLGYLLVKLILCRHSFLLLAVFANNNYCYKLTCINLTFPVSHLICSWCLFFVSSTTPLPNISMVEEKYHTTMSSEISIKSVSFPFDLMRLLPKCQQVELLFSTYIQQGGYGILSTYYSKVSVSSLWWIYFITC